MHDAGMVAFIEQAQRETPFCPCGASTIPAGHDGGVRLRCVSLSRRKGLVRRLLTLDFPGGHVDRRLVDSVDLEPAA